MSSNIGYHTRACSDDRKITGGSFGGQVDMQTANRLVQSFFTVRVKPSGHAVFVDKEGREVRLYFTIDAGKTDKGLLALKEWHKERARLEALAEEQRAQQQAEIDELTSGLTHDEIVRRLKGKP